MSRSEDRSSFRSTRSDVLKLREALQGGLSVATSAPSIDGKISPTLMLTKFEGRLSHEGGGDVSASWATGRQE